MDERAPDGFDAQERRWHEIETLRLGIAVLGGALISGIGSFLAFGQDVVHTNDLHAAMASASPYAQDKAAINVQLRELGVLIRENQEEISYIRDYLRSMSTQLALARKDISLLQQMLDRHMQP